MRTCGSTHACPPPSPRMLPSAPFPRPLPACPHPESLNRRGVYCSFTTQSEREREKIARRLVKKQLTHFFPGVDPRVCNQPFCTAKAMSKTLLHATSQGTRHHRQVGLQGQHLETMAELQRGIHPRHVWAKHATLSLAVPIPNLHLWHRATPDGGV